jgi:hypothetical protein
MPKAKHESERKEGPQAEKFQELARQLECNEDEKAFEETVKKVAKAPPAPEAQKRRD